MDTRNVKWILEAVQMGVSGWQWNIGRMGEGSYLQVVIPEAGEFAGCRKWYVSPWATTSEVVQTAFLAVKTAQEHELREQFTYCGKAIFGPHYDVRALRDLEIPHDVRTPMPAPRDCGPGATNAGEEGSTPSAGTKREYKFLEEGGR